MTEKFLGYASVKTKNGDKSINRAVYQIGRKTPFYRIGRATHEVPGFTKKPYAEPPKARAAKPYVAHPRKVRLSKEQCSGEYRLANYPGGFTRCVKSTKTGRLNPKSIICQTELYEASKGGCSLSPYGRKQKRLDR